MAAGTDTIAAAIEAGLPRQKVIRLGDSFESASDNCVSVALAATEYSEVQAAVPAVLSETVQVTCWSETSIADAGRLADSVMEALFCAGLRIEAQGRREVAESDRDGGYRGVESTYRIWAD